MDVFLQDGWRPACGRGEGSGMCGKPCVNFIRQQFEKINRSNGVEMEIKEN